METINITKKAAAGAISKATGELKDVLTELFGQQVWPENPIEAFDSYQSVCQAMGIALNDLPCASPKTKGEVMANAAVKLERIFTAFNTRPDGTVWDPDYTDKSQDKYTAWMEWSASAGGFVFRGTGCTGTVTYLGARLCTDTDAKAAYIGRTFTKELNEFLNPQI